MIKTAFGTTKKGEEATLFELTNKNGMVAKVTDFGANLVALLVPDKDGKLEDVVLGFDNVTGYEKNLSFFGAVIGPSANRIGNASFTIDGVEYKVAVNDGVNNLHSDIMNGVHKRMWKAEASENSVKFTIESEDMDMGFPGNKVMSITYTLTDDNEIKLFYEACSDKNTVMNPTNHSYFNLSGAASGTTIEDNLLTLNCSNYTPVVKGAIPTGEIAPVAGTVMDFTSATEVGKRINDSFEQLLLTGGYDHNYVVDGWNGEVKEIATVEDPKSGRVMKVYTDLPGVQFYAGNSIGAETGKDGASYAKRSGLCLETQYYPDTINQPNFPPCVFGPGKNYTSTTIYKFQ
ncbi:MAG: galactose mutarotase [Lachnospiraceae bacterium]|nr:galactose mutarotase [Lachnospiraceae bacterium]